MKIKNISRYDYEGIVYNLGVKDDKSYIANGIVVHNCRCLVIPITADEQYTESPLPPKTTGADANFK